MYSTNQVMERVVGSNISTQTVLKMILKAEKCQKIAQIMLELMDPMMKVTSINTNDIFINNFLIFRRIFWRNALLNMSFGIKTQRIYPDTDIFQRWDNIFKETYRQASATKNATKDLGFLEFTLQLKKICNFELLTRSKRFIFNDYKNERIQKLQRRNGIRARALEEKSLHNWSSQEKKELKIKSQCEKDIYFILGIGEENWKKNLN